MNKLRKTILSGVLVFGWMLVWGSGGPESAPAQAAGGLVIYVDDDPGNNGSIRCPSTPHTTIEAGIAAIGPVLNNVTLNICPGNYTGSMAGYQFRGFTNLKIIGKGNPVISAPRGMTGFFFSIVLSKDVTMQGLTIDGHGWLGRSICLGILFSGSSGTIRDNIITSWHQEYSGNPPYVVAEEATAIQAIGLPSGKQLLVLNNTVYDAQEIGISISGVGAGSKIKGNRIVLGSAIVPWDYPGPFRAQAGIALRFSEPGVEVSGNQIFSDADMFPQSVYWSRGIMLLNTSGAKVTGNTVRGTAAQITIENWCRALMPANNNIISGNKLYDTFVMGVYITSRNDGEQYCGIPHADFNQVRNNTIYNFDLNTSDNPYGQMAVYLEAVGDGVIDGAVVKTNTFAGFGLAPGSYTVRANGPNVIDPVDGPNRILTMPPAGVYK